MRKIVLVLTAAAALPLLAGSAQAQNGRWCTTDRSGAVNCGYSMRVQCQASISGVGGDCQRNIRAQAPRRGHRRPMGY